MNKIKNLDPILVVLDVVLYQMYKLYKYPLHLGKIQLMDIRTRVINCVVKNFGVNFSKVDDNFNIYNTNLSISEFAEFIFSLENEFSLDLDESNIPIHNIGDLSSYIATQIKIIK